MQLSVILPLRSVAQLSPQILEGLVPDPAGKVRAPAIARYEGTSVGIVDTRAPRREVAGNGTAGESGSRQRREAGDHLSPVSPPYDGVLAVGHAA